MSLNESKMDRETPHTSKTHLEIVPTTQPTAIIRVDMATETLLFDFLNAETPARLALLVMGCEMAIRRLLDATDGPDGAA